MENKKNIFIELSPEKIEFTPKPTPIKNKKLNRQRSKHGENLLAKLKHVGGAFSW